jgi:hypothetical protein
MKFWQTSLYKVDGFHLLISLSKCSHSSSLSFNFNEREPEITILGWVFGGFFRAGVHVCQSK